MRRSAGPRRRGRVLYGFVNHELTTTYLGSSDGAAAAPRAADRPLRLHRQDRRPHPERVGRRCDPRLHRRRRRSRWRQSLAQRLAWGKRRVDLPAGRYDTILPPAAVADLMIDAYWYAGARVAVGGRSRSTASAGAAPASATAIVNPGRQPVLRPGVRPACSARRSSVATTSDNEQSVFDNGLPLGRTDWIRDGELTALLQTRHSAAMTEQPVTPIDRQPRADRGRCRGHHRRPRRRHRSAACC